MKNFFLRYCKLYRYIISVLFNHDRPHRVAIPWEIYGDFDIHYLLFDRNGDVKKGCRTLREAIRERNNTGLNITVLYESA